MPKTLCAAPAAFTKFVGIEEPVTANMRFMAFFGDGTLNAKDSTNLIAAGSGGTTFSNIGSGPVKSPNYATFTSTSASLSTGMPDSTPEWSIVFAARPPPAGSAGQVFRVGTNSSVTWIAGPSLSFTGAVAQGGGVVPTLANRPAYPTWRMYGIACIVGSPVRFYDLTVGETVVSPSNVTTAGRPAAGLWEIGATSPQPGYVQPVGVAFAMGCHHYLTPAEMAGWHDAVAPMLASRGITGV